MIRAKAGDMSYDQMGYTFFSDILFGCVVATHLACITF